MTNSNCPKCNSLPSNENNPADWECGSSMRGDRHFQSFQCRAIELEAEVERLRRERDQWVEESMWTHFDKEELEHLKQWPWLDGTPAGKVDKR